MTPRPGVVSSARNFHVVLLAGGSGTRFWPLTRPERPKPLLRLDGRRSLLRQTWDRARRLAPAERIWVVSPPRLSRAVRRELPKLSRERLIVEPDGRDTGPAIALACATLVRHQPEATLAVLPTDHVVRDTRAFTRAMGVAREAARDGSLVCLGVLPERPATGFGYLRLAGPRARGRAVKVASFVEKPDARRAARLARSRRCLWNAGIFVFRAHALLEEAARHRPALHAAAVAAAVGRPGAWRRAPRISLDHAILERSRRLVAVLLDAGWDDLGSWDAAARAVAAASAGGRRRLFLDSPRSAVFGDGRFVAVVGVPGVVVVEERDVLLVVARASSERVKALVEGLRRRGRTDVL